MRPWTTELERKWLGNRIPAWKEAQREGSIQDWLVTTVNLFLATFSRHKDRGIVQVKAVCSLPSWFLNSIITLGVTADTGLV